MGRVIALIYGIVVYGIFFATFLYLIGFLGNFIVPRSIDVGPATPIGLALVINLGLIALFGVQHSVMARPAFKNWWANIVPRPVERSTYVLATSLILILLYWQWRPMGQIIWQADSALMQGVMWGVFGLGFLLVLLATFVIDHFDLFGLRQVVLNWQGKAYSHPNFKVTFFYRFIRHPIYLGWLLAFWGTPTMTLGHLLFATGMSAYILIAIRYEERDLVRFHGDDYTRYRKRVPMLVPKLGTPHETVKPGPSRPLHGHSS